MKIDYLTPDQAILSQLGKRLARVRKQQGVSQEQLAKEAGIGVATLRRIEGGKSGQMESWIKIMKALRMTSSIDALLPEQFNSPRAQVLTSHKGRKKRSARLADRVEESPATWGDETLE